MTFREFFDKLELNQVDDNLTTFFDTFAYILDLPDTTFNIMKDDFVKSLQDNLSPDKIQLTLSTPDGLEVDMNDLLEAIQSLINVIYEGVEEYKDELDEKKVEYLDGLLTVIADCFNQVPVRRQIEVGIEFINDKAKYPSYAHSSDAGADVYAVQNDIIKAGETKIIPTGFKVSIPSGYELQVRPRSGMSIKTKIRVANAPGTIDSGYDQEVGVILDNIGTEDYQIKEGDRICQLLISPCPQIKWINTKVEKNRNGGFGSTGK